MLTDQLRDVGVPRFRLEAEGDVAWLGQVPGVELLEVTPGAAVIEVSRPGAEQAVIAEAIRRGPVSAFATVRPALSEISREVTA